MNHDNLKGNNLRRYAEEIVANGSYPSDNISKDKLIHDLCVHQIELEIQNEELKKGQIRLENFIHKY